jgi:hypothetical protein
MSKTCLKQSPLDDAHLKIAKIYIKAPCACPTNFIGDFNVEHISLSKALGYYMKHYNFELTYNKL